MKDIVETLHTTSRLVKAWGNSQLADGRTLSETLTVEGIPFWDVFAVDLARIYMPSALHTKNAASRITGIVKPYFIRTKYGLRDLAQNRYTTHGCSTWPSGKTFLCLDFSEHISRDVVQPIATHLAEQKGGKVVSLMDHSYENARAYPHQNERYQTVWSHWDLHASQHVSKLRKQLYKIERDLHATNALSNVIKDGNRGMWAQLQAVFRSFFRAYLPLFVPHAVVAHHILERHRPALVISPDVADPRARVYTLLCRKFGIPCLEVQFGLVGPDGIEWRFSVADKLAVWGETSKEAMMKHSVSEQKIVITGSPRHDCLTNTPDAEAKALKTKLGVPEKSAMILLASAYQLNAYNEYSNPELLRSMKRSVFEVADKTNGICLVVKPHPVENVNETKSLAGENKNIIFVPQKSDIRDLVRICDTFISFGSTATADALISGKLVVCPVFPGWIWSDLYKNSGATLVPTSVEEIISLFKLVATGGHQRVLADLESARQKFVASWVYRADGMATKRIADLAMQMAQIEGRNTSEAQP